MFCLFVCLLVIHMPVVSQVFPQLKKSADFVALNSIIYFNKNVNTI